MKDDELVDRLVNIVKKQEEFQETAGIDLNTGLAGKLSLSESYLMKTIEEIVELRKTFPSGFNRWEKNPAPLDIPSMEQRMREELADVHLFLVNFMLVWGLRITDILYTIEQVQDRNMILLKERQSAKQKLSV